MRICFISEELPPETGWGGIGTYTEIMSTGLARRGHTVHVVARGYESDTETLIGNVHVHRLIVSEPSWRRGTRLFTEKFFESREIARWNQRVLERVRRISCRERLDLIESPEYHAQSMLAGLCARDIPITVRLHTPAFLCRRVNGIAIGGSRWDTLVAENLERLSTQRAALVTAPSRSLADEVGQAWSLNPTNVKVFPNPIDEERFSINGIARDAATIVFAGRLERRKGVESLIEAMPSILKRVPHARLLLYGADHPSGPGGSSMAEHLRNKIASYGIDDDRVVFCGPVNRTELVNVYRAATLSVIPSLYEAFGYTCLEAMACGCPVVVTRAGGLAEIVTDGVDGLCVSPGNAEEIGMAALRILTDKRLREHLGVVARTTVVQRYSRSAVSEAAEVIYSKLLREVS